MRAGATDPLLAASRVVLTVMMVATLAATAGAASAAAALFLDPDAVIGWLSRTSGEAIPPGAASPLTGTFALLAGISLLSFAAQRLLRRLVDSVGEGDPFVPENARRLASMAWITLTVQGLSIGVATLIGWVEFATGPLHGQFGFSLGGILLTLVLFILARVFRRGAAMREELEGTV
jgi:hypothetical protein